MYARTANALAHWVFKWYNLATCGSGYYCKIEQIIQRIKAWRCYLAICQSNAFWIDQRILDGSSKFDHNSNHHFSNQQLSTWGCNTIHRLALANQQEARTLVTNFDKGIPQRCHQCYGWLENSNDSLGQKCQAKNQIKYFLG